RRVVPAADRQQSSELPWREGAEGGGVQRLLALVQAQRPALVPQARDLHDIDGVVDERPADDREIRCRRRERPREIAEAAHDREHAQPQDIGDEIREDVEDVGEVEQDVHQTRLPAARRSTRSASAAWTMSLESARSPGLRQRWCSTMSQVESTSAEPRSGRESNAGHGRWYPSV